MRTSTKIGWSLAILISTILFCFIFIMADNDWYRTQVLVQEAVYEYVPASQAKIIMCWIGSAAFSILIGAAIGLLMYEELRKEEIKHDREARSG